MSRRGRILVGLGSGFLAFVLGSAILMHLNSEGLDAVLVRFSGPGVEPTDTHPLGLRAKPDYRLDIVHTRGTHPCGTFLEKSAAEGLRFALFSGISIRDVRELVLVEVDPDKEDVIARVPFERGPLSASGYAFTAQSSRSFWVGFDWYFRTPIGFVAVMAVALAILFTLIALARNFE